MGITLPDAAGRDRVNGAIAAAESRTSAEIVPVVAFSSAHYERAEDLWGACVAIALSLAFDLGIVAGSPPFAQWHEFSYWAVILRLLVLLAGALLGIVLSNRIAVMRRFFIPRGALQAAVARRARAIFFDQRIHHTSGRSGVLIYLSLFERRAVVLADETVSQTLGQPLIDRWCADLTGRLRHAPLADALEETIAQVGNDLATALPGTLFDQNELPDALIVLSDV